jgi:CIC family chloride channel protein
MTKQPDSLLGKFLVWRARHIPKRQFILMLSVLVGLISGLVATFLKNAAHYIQHLVQSGYFTEYYNPYYFIFPIIGIGIAVLISRLINKPIGEGIPSTLYAFSRRNGFLAPYRMYASVVTSIFTVGFGGSVGLEGPSVGTGSAIGSNIGRILHLNFKSRVLLMSCASAGAISSIFNAPIAAIIFTIEIFSLDLTFASLIPLLLASASGAVTSIFLQSNNYLISYKMAAAFQVDEILLYIALGAVTALVSVYFNKVYFMVERFFKRFKSPYARMLIGGSLLGALIFLIPPLYGEGYATINHLLDGRITSIVEDGFLYQYEDSSWFVLALLVGLVLFKVFASALTLGAGGVGGIFAPSLFIGASLGYVFAQFAQALGVEVSSNSSFILTGMAGLMAGVMHAPLTAIFMIAEITGGYQLFIPLMVVSAISFLVTRAIMPYSIYTVQLASRGELLTHNKDQVILTLLRLETVIESNFKHIPPEMNLGDLVKVVSKSKRNIFPVLNEEEELVGVLTLDDFRSIMFDQSMYEETTVQQLMSPAPAILQKEEGMESVLQKFQETGAWNLPVLDGKKYVGFVSKSKLFSVYRRKLLEFSE